MMWHSRCFGIAGGVHSQSDQIAKIAAVLPRKPETVTRRVGASWPQCAIITRVQQFFAYLRLSGHTSGNLALGFDSTCAIRILHLGKSGKNCTTAVERTATGTGVRMTELKTTGVTRRGLFGVFAATAVIAAPTYSSAFGLIKGAGDISRIRMYSGRTGE